MYSNIKKNINKINLYNDNFCVTFYKGHNFQNLKTVDIEKFRSTRNYIFRNACEFFYYKHMKRTNKAPSYDEIREIISNRKKMKKKEMLFIQTVIRQQLHVLKLGWVLQ